MNAIFQEWIYSRYQDAGILVAYEIYEYLEKHPHLLNEDVWMCNGKPMIEQNPNAKLELNNMNAEYLKWFDDEYLKLHSKHDLRSLIYQYLQQNPNLLNEAGEKAEQKQHLVDLMDMEEKKDNMVDITYVENNTVKTKTINPSSQKWDELAYILTSNRHDQYLLDSKDIIVYHLEIVLSALTEMAEIAYERGREDGAELQRTVSTPYEIERLRQQLAEKETDMAGLLENTKQAVAMHMLYKEQLAEKDKKYEKLYSLFSKIKIPFDMQAMMEDYDRIRQVNAELVVNCMKWKQQLAEKDNLLERCLENNTVHLSRITQLKNELAAAKAEIERMKKNQSDERQSGKPK